MNSPENLLLVYGQGGIGKSSLVADAADVIRKKHKKRSRIVGADGGGTKAFKVLMDLGWVDYWPIDQWDEKSIFLTLDLATKGWWPEDVNVPNSTLLPPTREYRRCPKCGCDSGATGLTMVKSCAQCKAELGAGVRLPKVVEPINGFDMVGMVAFEGATAFGNLLLNRLRRVDPTGGRSIKDGDFSISALGQQHYGDAQNYMMQYIANSRTIPVPIVMWTALELRGNDDFGKPVYGPAFPGKKLTGLCLPWFTDVLHMDAVPRLTPQGTPVRDAEGQEVIDRKLFLAAHYPPDVKPYKFDAKTSAPVGGGMPTVIEPSMHVFFDQLDKAYDVVRKKYSE